MIKGGKGLLARTAKACAVTISAAILMSTVGISTATAEGQAQIISQTSATISIEVNRGALIRLSEPVSNIFLATPAFADIDVKSPTLIYVFGLAPGETTLFALDENDDVSYSANIIVTHDLKAIKRSIASMLPDAYVEFSSIGATMVINGSVQDPADADLIQRIVESGLGANAQIINRLDILTPTQVNLRVKFAEVSRDMIKQLGVDFQGLNAGNNQFGIATGAQFLSSSPNPGFGQWFTDASQLGFDTNTATGLAGAIASIGAIPGELLRSYDLGSVQGTALYGSFGSGDGFGVLIDALESEGFVSVLAEPNLTAMSGEEASFLAGGEFPVPVPSEGGQIGIQYKPFGVSLGFVPVVITRDKVTLRVKPEVSQLSASGAIVIERISVPAISSRRVETTVELGSGESFAIAGLLQNTLTQDINETPFLSDLPILGALFRSDSFRRQESELVVIVTPYIVRPVTARQLSLPNDGYVAPSDTERYLRGNMYTARPRNNMPAPTVNGNTQSPRSAGFVLN